MKDDAAPSRRIRITLSYDGTNYHGWQVQPGLPTIQAPWRPPSRKSKALTLKWPVPGAPMPVCMRWRRWRRLR